MIHTGSHQFRPPSVKIMMIKDDTNLGYINVRSAPYNAKGDVIVFAPQGNYLIASQLTLPDATVLKGTASHVQRHWGDTNTKKNFWNDTSSSC